MTAMIVATPQQASPRAPVTSVQRENLGPAQRILETLLPYVDHCVHNRPGVVVADPGSSVGVRWVFARPKKEGAEGDEVRVVYEVGAKGRKIGARLGVLGADGKTITNGAVRVGEYRRPGFFREVVAWTYRQIAEVWKLDNEFAARWASYAFAQENRDLKVILGAFMLVQSRSGQPVLEGGKLAFHDEDYREVGEAMILLGKDKGGFNAKMVLRMRELLSLPEVAAINRELGFGQSLRRPELGRWPKVAQRWLRYREQNPKLLEGLVKTGLRRSTISLACQVRYVPLSADFYRVLRWKQSQAKDGRRKLALGMVMPAAESWEGLTEEEVCQHIVSGRPKWNRLTAMLPAGIGLTRAIMGAAIESGCLSDAELINLSPTIEELGLLEVQVYRERHDKALREAENMRAANIALRMKSRENREKLLGAADAALQRQVAEAVRGVFLYFIIDISGSMTASLPVAMSCLSQLLQGFPPEKLVVAVFSTSGRVVDIKHPSRAGVENAFRGIQAGGGTDHVAGVYAAVTSAKRPSPDDDVVMCFVGDGGQHEINRFVQVVDQSRPRPVAFGFLRLPGENFEAVPTAARALGIPCFDLDPHAFAMVATGGAADPYAVPRIVRALISAAPAGTAPGRAATARVSLVDTILQTELLKKPAWASLPMPSR